ncbi:hypothetical protein KXR91_28115 [Sinorhizobium meliloti]
MEIFLLLNPHGEPQEIGHLTGSAGLGIGFAPEWTEDMPNRKFEAP